MLQLLRTEFRLAMNATVQLFAFLSRSVTFVVVVVGRYCLIDDESREMHHCRFFKCRHRFPLRLR